MSLFKEINLSTEHAYKKALNLLDFCPQTEKMLSLKLIKKGYSQDVIQQVIQRLKKNNLLNELEYAKIYVDNLAKIKCLGKTKILAKLKEKGIDNSNADLLTQKAIAANGGEQEIMHKYIKKNIKAINRMIKANQIEKIKLKLFNNGFSFFAISKILNELKCLDN